MNTILSHKYFGQKDHNLFYILLILSYIFILLWSFLNNATWDDDCAGRYFNTVNSLQDPTQFVSTWNRPLWVLLFALPAQVGKFTIPIIMGLIACVSAWALYRSAVHLKLAAAYLVVPFLIFQPYFFGVGGDAMTEPLAVCLISLSLLFLLRKQWFWFAMMGSLLPLARLELAVVLIFWLIPLVQHRQWKYIPLLALFTLLLNVAGAMIVGEGDPMWLFHATVGGDNEENRYGHAPFYTYFERYFYVIGPVVFFFFINGLLQRLLNRKVSLFIDIQFWCGFLLYTLFAWKLNVGNSAAFLRNLIPLSPLATIIALSGFNYWIPAISKIKKAKIWLPLIFGILATVLTALFFRNRLKIHHLPTEDFDYFNLPLIVGVLVIMLLFWRITKKQNRSRNVMVLALILSGLTMAHTLISEPPDANMNPERRALNIVSDIYVKSNLSKFRTYCAATWFYWANDLNPYNAKRFNRQMIQDTLDAAPGGSVAIWETHYANRLGNNVSQGYFFRRTDQWAEIFRQESSDHKYVAIAFQKFGGANLSQTINDFVNSVPDYAPAYVARANLYYNGREVNKAMEDFNKARELEPENSFLYYSLGNIYMNVKNYTTAIQQYSDLIEKNQYKPQALYQRARCYQGQGNIDAACGDLRTAISLKLPEAQTLFDQLCGGK